MRDVSETGGVSRESRAPAIALISGDDRLREVVGSVAASIGTGLQIVAGRADAGPAWARPGPILVGQDRAAAVAAWQLPTRTDVHVVGADATAAARWSAALGASVVVVPEGNAALAELLRDGMREAGRGAVVLVEAAGGGLGASTLGAGIAGDAAAAGLRTALVELDPAGGGVDLLVGAERSDGWRWPELASARGTVTDLGRRLPAVDGVSLVSTGRDPCPVGQVARAAVVASLAADHDLVVLDRGHLAGEVTRGLTIDHRLQVVGADLRSLMTARAIDAGPAEIVLRRGPGRLMTGADVASVLGREPVATVPHDRRLVRAQEVGEAPWVMAGRRWRLACRVLRTAVAPDD